MNPVSLYKHLIEKKCFDYSCTLYTNPESPSRANRAQNHPYMRRNKDAKKPSKGLNMAKVIPKGQKTKLKKK